MRVALLALLTLSAAAQGSCECGNGKIKLWGPGGPHTALVPTAELFNNGRHEQEPQIEVCWGPEGNWRETALECAGGLFSAAEQQMAGFLRVYGTITDNHAVTPITLHAATLVVLAGNPLEIQGLRDLVEREDVRVVVNDGNYRDTLTSGTGVWEDVVGRLDSVDAIASVRSKIVRYAAGSGEARDALLGGDADVWFSWYDWAVAYSEAFDSVALHPDHNIARPLSLAVCSDGGTTRDRNPDVVEAFIAFLQVSPEATAEMERAGWFKSGAMHEVWKGLRLSRNSSRSN